VKDKNTEALIRVIDVEQLINPLASNVSGCLQAGEEEQDVAEFAKDSLVFPSDEELPRAWKDPDYQLKN
jgi:hypothetical protein